MATVIGTKKKETLIGTTDNDLILGLGGNDTLKGLAGDDRLDGGSGNDKIYGGAGKDTLLGGLGNDMLDGSTGVDVLKGGASDDVFVYDGLVAKYKAKPSGQLIKELKDKCAAMVLSDEQWIGSLRAQGDVDGRSLALASSLKAKDPRWTDAESAAQGQVTATAADVKKAEESAAPKK